MPAAIIGGTGIYALPGLDLETRVISTPFGDVEVQRGDEIVFLNRHARIGAKGHSVPPHRINYRANIKALQMLGVKRVCGAFAVGLMNTNLDFTPPVLLSDFIDMTSGRAHTFFDELNGAAGQAMGHVEMSAPFCPSLGQAIKDAAKNAGKPLKQGGIYIATNGPRFETPAEIKAYAGMGADVVGMTLCPEVPLAREAGMSYAGLALPLNWAAGVKPEITLEHGNIKARQSEMVSLIIRALAQTKDTDCIPAKIF